MKKYRTLLLFLICMALLKIAFAFLGDHDGYFSLRDFFTSVLNTENIASLTNASRNSAGLPAFTINPKLALAAQKKAENMLKNQYFAHTGPTGRTAWDFMDDAGYAYVFAGENLAMNFNSAEETLQGWLTSPKHRGNILDTNYTHIGIGMATGKFLGADTTIVVQMFGKPLRSAALISKKKMHISKRPVRSKGVSLKKYISQLVQNNVAQWNPSAKIHQIYAFSETPIPTRQVLNILFMCILASGLGVFVYNGLYKQKI